MEFWSSIALLLPYLENTRRLGARKHAPPEPQEKLFMKILETDRAGEAGWWDITGRLVGGPLPGARLDPIPHGVYLWFARAAFRPDTEVRK